MIKTKIEIHPELAGLMPARTDQEERELRESIKHYGVRDAVVVADLDGSTYIVDGHNRHRIASDLDVECPTREFKLSDVALAKIEAVYDAAERAREKLEAARSDLKEVRRGRKAGDAIEAAEKRVAELEEAVPELEGTLDERVTRIKLDEIKLWMIREQLSRRNVTPTDKVLLTRAANEIVYRRQAEEAQKAGQDRGRESQNGRSSIDEKPSEQQKHVHKRIAEDSGVSVGTTQRVMFVEDVAKGLRPEFADKQEFAREQLAEMRTGEVAPSAAERAIRAGETDAERKSIKATVPEDPIVNKLHEWRGWTVGAIAARYKAKYPEDTKKAAEWLDALAAELRGS